MFSLLRRRGMAIQMLMWMLIVMTIVIVILVIYKGWNQQINLVAGGLD